MVYHAFTIAALVAAAAAAHYEWEVVFSPADVDMMSVRAVFEADGQLMIHVRRRPAMSGGGEGFPPPLVCSR